MLGTLKIYGERNSGTRYLERLIAANLGVRLLPGEAPRYMTWFGRDSERTRDWYFERTSRRNLGWKHRLPPGADELALPGSPGAAVGFVTIVKNPYSWVLSLAKRPYSASRSYSSIEQLVTEPWATVGRECAPPTFPDAVAMWNAKAAANLALPVSRTANLRYEDLIADPESTLGALARDLNLPWRRDTFWNEQSSTKRSTQTFDDYRSYYLEGRWRAKLSESQVQLISQRLDPAVMARYGYEIL